MFQGIMSTRGVISVIAVIILLYPLAEAVDSDRDRRQLPIDNRIDWEEIMDEETAELLWVNCRAELVHSMEDFQDLQDCGNDKIHIGKERILKAIHVQDPHVKKTILDCLRDKRIVLSKSRKDKLARKWYIEYLVSFLHKPNNAPGRRRLAEGSVSHGTLIVVVIVTAVVTLLLAGLLFYCYIRNVGISGLQNDEKPLLSLSMGKHSTSGASKKSSNSKGKDGNTENQSNGVLDAQVCVDSGPNMNASLDPSMHPPAGRVKSSLRHTLKPRVVRAESSLRPTGKIETSIRPSVGKVESPVGGTESSPRQPPASGGSPVPSPTATAPPSPATAPPPATTPTPPGPPSEGSPPQGAPPPPPPTGGAGAPPPPPPTGGAGAPPPAPPTEGAGAPPPPPKPGENASGPPPPPRRLGASIRPPRRADPADASKAKLKPFFWDKVMAKPDQQMVWDKIKSGSFQFNEEMIESLFGYQAPEKNKDQDTKNAPAKEQQMYFIQIIDPKKAQNLSILLKALNVTTEEVSAALIEV